MLADVVGTCQSVIEIAEKHSIPEDDVEEYLLEEGIESCTGCGWWFEVGDLVDGGDENDGFCVECRGVPM